MVLGFALAFWLDQLLRRAGRPDLVPLNADAVPYLLAMVSAATVGAVVASRRPRHPAEPLWCWWAGGCCPTAPAWPWPAPPWPWRRPFSQPVTAFRGRLRDEVDLDTLSAELLAVTDQTMQPTTVSPWQRARL